MFISFVWGVFVRGVFVWGVFGKGGFVQGVFVRGFFVLIPISPLPGCSKQKSGKSVSVEEQQIILNVAKYFQEESKSGNKPQFRAGAVIAKTAAATGVSKNSVRKIVIVSAGKVINERKTRKAKVRFGKLDNFDVFVIRRIIHNLYRENISPSLKKILLCEDFVTRNNKVMSCMRTN